MGHGAFGTILQIGDILVSEDVIETFFSCDYEACRGRCCIEGDSGAPLDEPEAERLERDYPRYESLIQAGGRDAVAEKGFFEIDIEGDMVTPLVRDTRECAFCHFSPEGSCLCAIELAGCTKPVSCSLYPIRVTRLTGGGQALNLHRWDICRPAFEKGEKEGVRVWQFLEKPLRSAFGDEFYDALCAGAEHILNK